MDYFLKSPIEYEGETYNIALFYLSAAPVIRGNDYTTAVNLQIIPARRTGTDMIQLHSHTIRMELTSDIKNASSSQDILMSYGGVSALIVGLAQRMNIVAETE